MTPVASREDRQLRLFGTALPDALHPSHVTYTGGADEPGHLWYPYLEGYSPEFVRHTLVNYMPSARRIIDPFGGAGTTPLTLSAMGLHSGYCEINPVLRAVVDAKLAVAALPMDKRRTIREALNGLARALPSRLARSTPDAGLSATYSTAFGQSAFFQPDVFGQVLRLRTVANEVLREDRLLGQLLTVAIMSRLVMCSLLKRAGDVRYKTPKEVAKGIPPLVDSVGAQLQQMEIDVDRLPESLTRPALLGVNAKDLQTADTFAADGVITSPPYLNGTNYIRNTKLELWFLGALRSGGDLRLFRDQVITSGINDVVAGTGAGPMHPGVASIVDEVRAKAYDSRIPKMVAGYFADMADVLRGLAHQTVTGAVVCIDIGDSRYAGVNVPTPRLLADVAETLGFKTREIVQLRTRLSKDKTELSQDLIVLERSKETITVPTSAPSMGDAAPSRTLEKWAAFKEQLPHRLHPFTKRNWGHPLHSVCSYSGKMKPSLAHVLVEAFSRPGDVVFDPFSGSGTIPFEAALGGRRSLGLDIAVLPVAVSNAKLMRADPTAAASLLRRLDTWIREYVPSEAEIEGAAAVRFNGPIPTFFHERTFHEVLAARAFFGQTRDDSAEWSLAMASMLHILHGNRPYALSRRSHPITPYAPTGETVYKSVVEKLTEKVMRSLEADYPREFVSGACFQGDVLTPWPEAIRDVDTLITSPPFFDSTRFYMANWMRYWFAGWERPHFDEEPERFVETKQRQSFAVYSGLLEQARDRLRPGGTAIFHLGLSKKCDMAEQILGVLPAGFDVVDNFSEGVEHCESHGIRDKGTVTAHQYLVLRRA
jgi:DNA modification methylase